MRADPAERNTRTTTSGMHTLSNGCGVGTTGSIASSSTATINSAFLSQHTSINHNDNYMTALLTGSVTGPETPSSPGWVALPCLGDGNSIGDNGHSIAPEKRPEKPKKLIPMRANESLSVR
jgi:hypothetical protein